MLYHHRVRINRLILNLLAHLPSRSGSHEPHESVLKKFTCGVWAIGLGEPAHQGLSSPMQSNIKTSPLIHTGLGSAMYPAM